MKHSSLDFHFYHLSSKALLSRVLVIRKQQNDENTSNCTVRCFLTGFRICRIGILHNLWIAKDAYTSQNSPRILQKTALHFSETNFFSLYLKKSKINLCAFFWMLLVTLAMKNKTLLTKSCFFLYLTVLKKKHCLTDKWQTHF